MEIREIEDFARCNLDYYGLPLWVFKFNKSKVNVGLCDYEKKTIFYSKYYLDRPTIEIQHTILHEIAHALTPFDKHGRKWALACEYLGIPPLIYSFAQKHPEKFVANCSCGNVWYRYNSNVQSGKKMCSTCLEPLIFKRNPNVEKSC